ncbi:unnamed protein product [Staurois parvus]|uniref:Uncharacterized protein n=1 Tax=Staurois parvus TaxID=386267 RepID=A0ABN9AYZ5_9NEOB|nr:unnamed protein product [Staurois parvus]
MARQEQCRSGLPFINGACIYSLCALPGSTDRCTGPLCKVPIM